jgi:hypothetical protein
VPFAFVSPIPGGWYQTGDRQVGSGFDVVPVLTLQHAVEELKMIDLLKVGCPASLMEIIQHAMASGLACRIRWICGRLATDHSVEAICEWFRGLYTVEVYETRFGRFLTAQRRE